MCWVIRIHEIGESLDGGKEKDKKSASKTAKLIGEMPRPSWNQAPSFYKRATQNAFLIVISPFYLIITTTNKFIMSPPPPSEFSDAPKPNFWRVPEAAPEKYTKATAIEPDVLPPHGSRSAYPKPWEQPAPPHGRLWFVMGAMAGIAAVTVTFYSEISAVTEREMGKLFSTTTPSQNEKAAIKKDSAPAPVAPPIAEVPKALPTPTSLPSLSFHSMGPAAETSWPRGVALPDTPEVTVIKEDTAAGEFIYRVPPYEFRSDTLLGPDTLRDFARVFKSAWLLNCLLPLDLRPTPEKDHEAFIAKIFRSKADYHSAGGMPGSSGTYLRDQGVILVPLESIGVKIINNRVQTEHSDRHETLIHEITHQMMNAWLPRLPLWFIEGSAEYAAMAEYIHGRFYLSQMQDRLRLYLRDHGQKDRQIIMRAPAALMTTTHHDWAQALGTDHQSASANYTSAALLTYYFYHLDGQGDAAHVIAWLRDLERGRPPAEALEEHLLRGRSPEKLANDLANAFHQTGMKLEFVN